MYNTDLAQSETASAVLSITSYFKYS